MANPSKLNPHDRQNDYASDSYLRRIKAEIRKTNKPIMEKKRRARINNYLNDLKSLLLDAMKKDPVRHSKLEKADILDLTVKHLQDVERRRLNVAMAVDPTVPEKFATGYRECIDEIGKYFDTLGTVDEGLKARVRKHLESCLTFPGVGSCSLLPPLPPPSASFGGPFGFADVPLQSPDDINNNNNNNNSGTNQGLLNRTLANNLSLMFAPGLGGFSTVTDSSTTFPFQPFPFFGRPLQRPPHSASNSIPVAHQREEDASEEAPASSPASGVALTVPSPPASPRSSPVGGDSSEDGTGTTLRTPVGKAAGTPNTDHQMERLLAIFPTPPSPEEQPARSRLGKLGHHFDSSPFVPTGRARSLVSVRGSEERDTEPETGGESSNQGRRAAGRNEDDIDADGKERNANGDMWRPW
uniref:BHLH domain-containing protein n=1 Tax=Anopheles farauti TaxID=69004 RepID=A0A182PZJ8_9DIPT